jgi:hypothetical protein
MNSRLVLLAVLGAVSACNAPQQAEPPAPSAVREQPAAVLSGGQLRARAELCAKISRERFRIDASQGVADAQGRVDYAQHYNARLDSCFLVLTASSPENPGSEFGTSPATVVRKLIDVGENEIYGEYLGPSLDALAPGNVPAACRVLSMHCGSGREWEVLVRDFMED